MFKRILITGGAGFVGHHCVDHLLKITDWEIVILDSLNYAGNMNRITDSVLFTPERVKFVWHDLRAPISESTHKLIGKLDYCIHFAAESHVDRSLVNSIPFAMSNVVGTAHLLEYIKHFQPDLEKYIGFNCYDEKTRAVTKDGLKYYHELKRGDIVFTLNLKTRQLEQQPVENVIIQDYNGETISFKSNGIDLLVTPNHRMYDAKMNVVEADKIKKFVFPKPAFFKGRNKDIIIGGKKPSLKYLFYLIGIFLGDGFTAYQEKITENKSGLTKKERDRIAKDDKTGRFVKGRFGDLKTKLEKSYRIFLDIPENDKARGKTEKALENLGINFTKQKGKAGEHLYFSSKEWLSFFNQFGRGAENKFIPEWILEYDEVYLRELFNGLIDSDGYWESMVFSTVSERLKDNVCELSIKLGLMPNVNKIYSETIFENRIIKGWSYFLNFRKTNKAIDAHQKGKITRENYRGKIWCITVKNKNFLVERNGKYIFSGNTDECFGSAPENVYYKEIDKFHPSNPYAASKCGQWAFEYSFAHTFKLPIVLVHSMNIMGERQVPEKFVPKTIKDILNNQKVNLHGRSRSDIASRCWIHARNVADALFFLLAKGQPKETYNIVGEEKTVLEIADWICETIKGRILNEDEFQFVEYPSERPGHDKRYALSGEKLAVIGWHPPKNLEESLKKTVKWTLEHQKWLTL